MGVIVQATQEAEMMPALTAENRLRTATHLSRTAATTAGR
jgi:hypothetical protein